MSNQDNNAFIKRVNPEDTGSKDPTSSMDKNKGGNPDNKKQEKHQPTDSLGDELKDDAKKSGGLNKASSDKESGKKGLGESLKDEFKNSLTTDLDNSQGLQELKGPKGRKGPGDKSGAESDFDAKKTMKTAKNAAQAGQVAAKAGIMAQTLQMMKTMMMFLLNMLTTAASAVAGAVGGILGFLQGIVQFVSGIISAVGSFFGSAVSFIGGLFSIGSTAAAAVVTSVAAVAVVTPVLIVATIIGGSSGDPAQYDAGIMDCAEQFQQTADKILEGDLDAIQLEHAKKVFSIYKSYGLTDNQIAGMLGNWSVESGIDPTGVEGIYGSDEKYRIGPKKQKALDNHDSYTKGLFQMYASRGIGLNHAQYMGQDGGYWPGLGMPQFTAGDRIVVPAEKLGKKWYDMDFQMAFILAKGTAATTGAKGGVDFFNTYKKETASMSPSECASYFLRYYEGVPSDVNASKRGTSAESWAKQLSSWSVDKAYADSVFEMAKELGAIASDSAISDAKERCVKIGKYDNSDIANAAASYSWPTHDQGNNNDGTDLFQRVYVGVWGMRNYNGQPMQSCDVGVSTAVRWSGSDIDYPAYSTRLQLEYLLSSPKWEKVGMMGSLTMKDLQPGDVGVLNGHTWLYTGEEAIQKVHGKDNPGNSVSASYYERSPGAGQDATYYFSTNGIDSYHGKEYYIFRLVKPDNSDKYKSAGESVSN